MHSAFGDIKLDRFVISTNPYITFIFITWIIYQLNLLVIS